ncbi:MAG: TonB-dependent receptor, partial [Sphingobacteriales bacterium]
MGYNGNLRASIDSRMRPGGGADINIKQNKVNFFAAAQFNMRKSLADNSTDRIDYPANNTAITTQENNPLNKGYFGFGRAGIDFLMTNRTTLSVSGNYMQGNFKVKDQLKIAKDTIKNWGTVSETSIRDLSADISFKNTGASIGVKHNFAKAGKEWTADANYNRNHNRNVSNYSSRYFDSYGNEKPYQGAEKAEGGSSTAFYTFQTDFVNPLGKNIKFETGLRAAFRDYESWNDNFRQIPPSTLFTPLTATNVDFDFEDVVYAAYGIYSQQIKNFSYQLGLRTERSSYKGFLRSKNERFANEYPVSLFPSVFLSQKINSRQDVQLNYSRKISRPGFFQILPFVDFSDSLNLSVGNPDLRPEFSQLAELSYNNNYKTGHSVLATAYARYSDNLITR